MADNYFSFLMSGTNNLGGAISNVPISGFVNEFFDVVYLSEAESGNEEYRCFYILNSHPTAMLQNIQIWVDSYTGTNFSIEMGLGTSDVNGIEQTIANKNTPPSGVVFVTPLLMSPLVIHTLRAGDYKAVWIKRIIYAGCPPQSNVGVVIKVIAQILPP